MVIDNRNSQIAQLWLKTITILCLTILWVLTITRISFMVVINCRAIYHPNRLTAQAFEVIKVSPK